MPGEKGPLSIDNFNQGQGLLCKGSHQFVHYEFDVSRHFASVTLK